MPQRSRRGSQRSTPARARSRRSGAWIPLCILALLVGIGWFGTPAHRRPDLVELQPDWWPASWDLSDLLGQAEEGSEAPQLWIDPGSLDWELVDSCDPRWDQELALRMEELEPFPIEDQDAFMELVACLESISFVESVEFALPDAELGCELELVLREPVACIPSNGLFYAVDAQGVLLTGTWEMPPYCDGLPLPVLGPMSDGETLFSRARPGDWLMEPDHLDALQVALSMDRNLSMQARTKLGRLVIDATESREASVSNPGIRLLLGGQRLVLFGRPVDTDEPGELSARSKWASLESCLTGEAAEALAGWGLLDLRWDHPEVDIEPVLLAQAAVHSLDLRASAAQAPGSGFAPGAPGIQVR